MGLVQSNATDALKQLYDQQTQRQIVLLTEIFAEQQALKMARLRENLLWEYLAGGTILTTSLLLGLRTKNKFAIVPAVPIIMAVGYHSNQCTEAYINDVYKEAEKILSDPKHRTLVRPVGGPITLGELDERRKRWNSTNLTD